MMLVLISVLMLTTFSGVPVVSQEVEPVPCPSGPYDKFGPRVDRLIFRVSGGVTNEWTEFEAGKMDVLDWAAPADRWSTWTADPLITMGLFEEFAPIYLALNTMRWPLGHGDQFPEGWTSYPANYIGNHQLSLWSSGKVMPSDYGVGTAEKTWIDYDCQRCLDSRQFRRALAHIVDRTSQLAYMKGAGSALEPSLFWPSMKSWEASGIPTYAYSTDQAIAILEAAGFKNWDPSDSDIEYSPGHDGVIVENLPVLQIYTRSDDDHRINAGKLFSESLKLLGIPHSLIIATYGTVATEVWAEYDYDIYFEYWPWDPLPNFYSEWFRSTADIYKDPWGNNEHRYHSKEFDVQAEFFSNSTTLEAARPYCDEMQRIIGRDVPAIPYYSYVGYNAYRTKYGTWPGEGRYAGKNWIGMCNFPGEGFYDYSGAWTALNAHVQGFEKGGTLRQGLNIDAEMLDIMDFMYFYDGLVLYQIYEPLVKSNPWDMSRSEPWLCESYNVATWQHPTKGTCTAVNFTLIPGVLWQDGKPMTAEDVGFSFWFTRETKSANYMYAEFFDSYKIYSNVWWNGTVEPGRETIEIRFNKPTWQALCYYCSGIRIIPKHVWEPVGVKGSAAYIPEDHDTVFGTGPFRFYKDGVVGRVNRVAGEYLYLEPNPLYFRKYVYPDVCGDPPHKAGVRDGEVDIIDDFLEVAKPGNIWGYQRDDGTWTNPTWGPYCDVNRDGKVGVADLMEIGTHFKDLWPPAWWAWTWKPPP